MNNRKKIRPALLQLTQVGESIVSTEQQKLLVDQLVEKQSPKGIDLDHEDHLSEDVELGIASYNPEANELSFIASASNILPY